MIQPNNYCTIADLVTYLLQERQNNPKMKLAFAFEGGGAKGCYHGGVLEGIAQLLAPHGGFAALRPDIIAGTSVGAIAAFGLWLDMVYPGRPAGSTPYQLRQSALWQQVANGNNAAPRLLAGGDILAYVTNEKEIPLLGPILAKVQLLQTDLNTLSSDLTTAKNAFNAIQTDLNSIARGFSQAAQNALNSLTSLFGTSGIITAFQKFNVTDPTTYGSVPAAISTLGNISAGDLVSALNDISNAVNGVANQNPGLVTDLPKLVSALQTVGNDMTGLMADLLNPTDPAENIVDTVVTLLESAAVFFQNNTVGGGAPGSLANVAQVTNVLADNVLTPTGLKNLLTTLQTGSPNAPGGGTDAAVLADWLSRATATTPNTAKVAPELYLSGSNITQSRLMVYAIAKKETIQLIADDDTWVVDLAGSTRAFPSGQMSADVFFADSSMAMPMVTSVMSSAALPVAFPPVNWTLDVPTGVNSPWGTSIKMVVVDGGIMDNSPFDVAIKAGATHVVSFELDQLLSYRQPTSDQGAPFTFVGVLYNSLQSLMTRVWNESVNAITEANAANPAKQVPIFRIGPIPEYMEIPNPVISLTHVNPPVSGPISEYTFLDFNGHWESPGHILINMEDRFMQGYQDVMHLSPPPNAPGIMTAPWSPGSGQPNVPSSAPGLGAVATSDPVFNDYLNRARASGTSPTGRVSWAKANMAYYGLTKAYPNNPL